jgi:hypothetical protein
MMEDRNLHAEPDSPADASSAFARADLAYPFGPSFFMTCLGRFVRDHCPERGEDLPVVELRLGGGESLLLCHVIGVASRWVMLAVIDTRDHRGGMAVEFVPYELICGVSIRTGRLDGDAIGFSQTRAPEIIPPETLVRAAIAPGLVGRS